MIVWDIGGRISTRTDEQLHGIDDGSGHVLAAGTTARMVHTDFLNEQRKPDVILANERRLAAALQIDRVRRILVLNADSLIDKDWFVRRKEIQWCNSSWVRKDYSPVFMNKRKTTIPNPKKAVPNVAFRVLDAPRLKDDYYCSVLAYCITFRTLAVALSHRVYLWDEVNGVRYPPIPYARPFNYVMSLAFSSEQGAKGILAIARSNGHITLWGLSDSSPRVDIYNTCPASCVSFRPTVHWRSSEACAQPVACEDLLVGDDNGNVSYYSIQWSEAYGDKATLLVKIRAHEQNVCGLAWAPDGMSFVTGGNDNIALLFVLDDLSAEGGLDASCTPANRTALTKTRAGLPHEPSSSIGLFTPPPSPEKAVDLNDSTTSETDVATLKGMHRYCFTHAAAVKAVAFAPWQPTLLATGGGSNDKQIHFHHTGSGTTLAVINVFAQVTSLVWSTTRREIVATFGYAQPEHEIRIAVFSWPSCQCTVSIPWERKQNGEISRALWAIPYPGGPNETPPTVLQPDESASVAVQMHGRTRRDFPPLPTPDTTPTRTSHVSPRNHVTRTLAPKINQSRSEGEPWATRTQEEGSLIIACCDQTVKFFEVWAGKSKGRSFGLGTAAGVLGGSRILEAWCDKIAVDEVGEGQEVIR